MKVTFPGSMTPLGKIQKEKDPEKRLFLAALHHLDHAIGRVTQTLEDRNYCKTPSFFFPPTTVRK